MVACSAALTGFVVGGGDLPTADSIRGIHPIGGGPKSGCLQCTTPWVPVSRDEGCNLKKAADSSGHVNARYSGHGGARHVQERAKQVAIARGCLQTSFRNMHGSMRI